MALLDFFTKQSPQDWLRERIRPPVKDIGTINKAAKKSIMSPIPKIAKFREALSSTRNPYEVISKMAYKPIKEKIVDIGEALPQVKTPLEAIQKMTSFEPVKKYLESRPSNPSSFPKNLPQQEMTRKEFLRMPEKITGAQIATAIERLDERDETWRKAEPKYSINSITNFVRDKLPFLRTTESIGAEKALKKEVMNVYNYTDEAKEMIEDIKIKDASPVIDSILGMTKEGRGIKPYGGFYRHANVKYPEFLGERKKVTVRKGHIENADLRVNVTAHELLHHFWEKSNREGFNVRHLYEDFPRRWEEYLTNYKKGIDIALREGKDEKEFVNPVGECMIGIDDTLRHNPLYENNTPFDNNNERFAYFGDQFGQGGLQNIPEEFQEFYAYFYK